MKLTIVMLIKAHILFTMSQHYLETEFLLLGGTSESDMHVTKH